MPSSLDEQPEAGPSSRPYHSVYDDQRAYAFGDVCDFGDECPLVKSLPATPFARPKVVERARRKRPRQGVTTLTIAPSSTSSNSVPNTSTTSTGLFVGPSSTSSGFQPTGSSGSTSNNQSSTSTTGTTTTGTTTSSTVSKPWDYSSRTTSGTAAAKTSNVPGVMLNLTLAGTSETQAVYSVPLSFGHAVDSSSAVSQLFKKLGKRKADWDGTSVQTVNLQVDLGSSDLWVASDMCTSSSCSSSPSLFNSSASLDSGSTATLTYQGGAVNGEIYWEQVSLGDFGIGYQAFISATSVVNEDLNGGNYAGVLGLALPANSVILQKIPGTTSSDPDGATFLDNLFGSGASAPSQRLFSLSLARREDVRTSSVLGIGAISSTYCPAPCSPTYVPIIAQPSLGVTGYLHWRVQIQGIAVTKYSDEQAGTGLTSTAVSLGASQVDSQKSSPLAVLDSGGVQILVGYRPFLDAIYSVAGISMSSDGLYRMSCTTPFSLTFNIGGKLYPVHPLDMSWPDPSDPSQSTCIGALQYSSTLGDTGDFILGSSFMKNVYSIFQYPDVNKTVTWQPTVGLIALTNASVASQDFYAVRTLRQSLSSVSSAQQATSASGAASPSSNSQASSAAPSSSRVISAGIIAAVTIVGFFVFAAGAFCLWWFWWRRKLGASGSVSYKAAPVSGRDRHRSQGSGSSLRSKKHEGTARQKSMVEGYSDFEGDSWLSGTGTEGTDSIRLGYMPELVEEDEGRKSRGGQRRDSGGASVRTSSVGTGLSVPANNLIDVGDGNEAGPTEKGGRRESSPSGHATRTVSFSASPLQPKVDLPAPISPPQPYIYPHLPSSNSSHSMTMAGPFPSPSPSRHPLLRHPDPQGRYTLNSTDFFTLIPDLPGSASSTSGPGSGSRGRRDQGSGGSASLVGGSGGSERDSSGSKGARPRRGGPHGNGVLGDVLSEEPDAMGN